MSSQTASFLKYCYLLIGGLERNHWITVESSCICMEYVFFSTLCYETRMKKPEDLKTDLHTVVLCDLYSAILCVLHTAILCFVSSVTIVRCTDSSSISVSLCRCWFWVCWTVKEVSFFLSSLALTQQHSWLLSYFCISVFASLILLFCLYILWIW